MGLHTPRSLKVFVGKLPGTSMVDQWGSHVAKVGGKVFALIGVEGGYLAFKVTELSFEALTTLEGVGQAPYFARRQWVSVSPEAALSDAELRAYVKASYDLIAAKLTRKLRAELGIG